MAIEIWHWGATKNNLCISGVSYSSNIPVNDGQ